jgi:heme-degrading monooxygenase HmoA
MIKRLVKMTFKPSSVELFKAVFASKKELIGAFPGCKACRVVAIKADERIFFTSSVWEREADLENYRVSSLFTETWAAVKPHFDDRPEAWTVTLVE